MSSSLLWAFNNNSPTYPLLASQSHYPNICPNKDLALGTNRQPCGRHHRVYIIRKPITTQPYIKPELFRKKLEHLHLKDFLKYKYELYLKQPLTSLQRKIIAPYCTSNHRLAITIGWWTIIPILHILYSLQILWDKWLQAWVGFANHLALIACSISYEKWVSREKCAK